jgi:hypothetical protein
VFEAHQTVKPATLEHENHDYRQTTTFASENDNRLDRYEQAPRAAILGIYK